MNKHVWIVVAASMVIAMSAGYSVFNAVTLDELQIRWNQRSSFDYLTMLNGGYIEVCNLSFIPLRFSGMDITPLYRGESMGRFSVDGAVIEPNSVTELAGMGETTGITGQIISMYLDTEISGTDLARMDTDEVTVLHNIDTVFFGMIPYSISETYTGKEFSDMMNGQGGNYC